MTIGAFGAPWTADAARQEAKKLLGRVANGEDPAKTKQDQKKQLTLSELCDLYLEQGVRTKKQSTIDTDKGRIERHIKPLLGKRKINQITKADVKRFLNDVASGKTAKDIKTKKFGRAIVRGGEGTATRTVGLLGGIFSFAIDAGLLEFNPAHGVKRFKDKKGERFLSAAELKRLGDALVQAEEIGLNFYGIQIIRLLILTGARKGEIEKLKWSELDFENGYMRLQDSKTGQKALPLNAPALEVVSSIPREGTSRFVFPAETGPNHYQGTPKVWRKIRDLANLEDVRMHDLRHSFASIAVSGGASLPLVGALLGHADAATTQRYAHFHSDPVKLASEKVAGEIASVIGLIKKA
jgi:integrase